MKNLITRINELAAKKKQGTINKKELKELLKLREEYLVKFRSKLHQQLSAVKVIDPMGNDVTPKKKQRKQN